MSDFMYGCRIFWQALKHSFLATCYLFYCLIRHPVKTYDAFKWAWNNRKEEM